MNSGHRSQADLAAGIQRRGQHRCSRRHRRGHVTQSGVPAQAGDVIGIVHRKDRGAEVTGNNADLLDEGSRASKNSGSVPAC